MGPYLYCWSENPNFTKSRQGKRPRTVSLKRSDIKLERPSLPSPPDHFSLPRSPWPLSHSQSPWPLFSPQFPWPRSHPQSLWPLATITNLGFWMFDEQGRVQPTLRLPDSAAPATMIQNLRTERNRTGELGLQLYLPVSPLESGGGQGRAEWTAARGMGQESSLYDARPGPLSPKEKDVRAVWSEYQNTQNEQRILRIPTSNSISTDAILLWFFIILFASSTCGEENDHHHGRETCKFLMCSSCADPRNEILANAYYLQDFWIFLENFHRLVNSAE